MHVYRYNKRMLSIICSRQVAPFWALLLAFGLMTWVNPAFAQGILPLPADGAYGGILEQNRVNRVVEEHSGSYNFFESLMYGLFSSENMKAANIVFGAIGIVYLIVVGAQFILSQGEEEKIQNAQKHFAYVVLGLMLISVSQFAGFVIFNPDQAVNPDYFVNDNVHMAFYNKAMQVKLYIQIIIGGIALLSIVTSAFRIMGSTGNEEVVGKEKQLLQNFFFATALILLSEVVVKGIFYLPGQNREGITNQATTTAITEIMGLVNALISIVAGAALLMLILASLYYVISLGDEERAGRAKRLVISTLTAVVIIFSAYSILRFFF